MAFVKNIGSKTITHNIEGKPYVFEPGKIVPFKDRSFAIFMCGLSEVTASPADGRKGSRPLVLLENDQVADKELQAQATPDKAAPLPPAPSTFVPPKEGHVAQPDPEIAAIHARKNLMACEKDFLVGWCRKFGVYQKGMDKPRMADALARVGFKPPPEFVKR